MNKTLIGIKDSIMYKIAQFAFFLLTIILLGGGIYSWSTLKEMETKLPITSLEQHNNIKTMIDGLVRLSNSLVLLKDKIDDESIRETTLINLDICFNLHKNFEKTIPELNHEKYVVVLNEINYVMNSMDGYLNNEESLSEVEVKTLYTRLDEIIIELNSVYLDTNQQVVNVLMIQSKQIEFLKFTLTIVFMIIALSAGIIGLLAFLQKTVIKELNQKEEELTEARKLADKANEAKSSFLANMSHEIRTPMNAIIGINELLKRTTLNRKQLDYTSKMETSAKNLLSLINDILDFSKIEAGKLDLEIIDFNLEEVLDNVSNIIGSKAFEKGLEFVIDKDFQIPLNLKELADKKRKAIAQRATVNDEWDYGVQQSQKAILSIISESPDDTIHFIENECTADELSWLSEIYDEMIDIFPSQRLIEALRKAADKYPEEVKKYNLDTCIDEAEGHLTFVLGSETDPTVN